MPIVVEANEARKNRRSVEVEGYTNTAREEDKFFATLYIGAAPSTAAADLADLGSDKSLPQAYLVEQPAAATVPPHFHDSDQFQVFVAGKVAFGKKPVRSLSLHYAGYHTPYGPIVTKDQGAHYFTLRAQWDAGGKLMPESSHLLKPVPRRHRLAEDICPAAASGGRADVLPCESDGLGAALFNLAPSKSEILDMPFIGAGQYALVVSGTVSKGDAKLSKNSCVYRYAEDEPLNVVAGVDGARVLLMQFPLHGDA